MELEQLKNLKKGTNFVFSYTNSIFVNIFFASVLKISEVRHEKYILKHIETVHFSFNERTNEATIMIYSNNPYSIPIQFDRGFAEYYHIESNKFREGKLAILSQLFGASTVKFQ